MKTPSNAAPVDSRNARTKRYKKVLSDITKAKVCPFCPESFKWHTKPILSRNGSWLITENFQPYPNAKYHFLLVGKEHKETLAELTTKDLESLIKLTNWATREFDIKGGGLTIRFGDTLYTGATVRHLHAHYIVPQVENGQISPVYFPIG